MYLTIKKISETKKYLMSFVCHTHGTPPLGFRKGVDWRALVKNYSPKTKIKAFFLKKKIVFFKNIDLKKKGIFEILNFFLGF